MSSFKNHSLAWELSLGEGKRKLIQVEAWLQMQDKSYQT